MDHKHTTWFVVVLVLATGCITVPQGDTPTIEGDAEYNRSSNVIEVTGGISVVGGIASEDPYTDVRAKLYTENEGLICSVYLGDLEQGEGFQFTAFVEAVPHYVIYESPDFWSEDMKVRYKEYNPDTGEYVSQYASSEEEMPIWNPDETGPEYPDGTEET